MRGLILLLLACAWLGPFSRVFGADEPPPGGDGGGRDQQPPPPLTEVVLYSSGVGYFERDGQVDGSAKVELRFKVDDINDLLKSMVVQDFDGGQVSAVTYGSRDPITKTLKSFGVDLTDNPTLGALLNQVRGERITVATPNPITGVILGVETKRKTAGRDDDQVVEVEYLNLLTSEGLRSIPLDQVQRLELLNEQIASELRQALEVLATGHDTQKKTVTIRFDGAGKRNVSIAYITETPVWKTSYRLVLDDEKPPYLQGWAIVENTTDDDWDGVRLSLISGRPISFIMDLYQPLYAPRPAVQPELYGSLRPQVYGQAMDDKAEMLAAEEAPAAPGYGVGGFAAPAAAPAPRALMRRAGPMAAAEPEMAKRGIELQQGVSASAVGLQAGELFQYAIKSPVTLARQRSAMLPILGEEVQGEKVSIYNESVQPKYPLNGFRLKNTTALHLMQGPITVFNDGAYAGDARIEDLAPKGERLISYALDLAVEVEPQHKGGPQDLTSVALRKGTLIARRRATDETIFQIKNRDQKAKTVLIEQPYRSDWDLKQPKEPAERTRDVYRFSVPVKAGESASLDVVEERQYSESIGLADIGPNILAYYLQAKAVGPKVKEALQKVVTLRNALEQTRAERNRREARINEISQEQSRIRENMARLAQNSELYNRYVTKLDQQETELEGIRKQIENLKQTETRQQNELNDYLLNLDLEG